jgi:hypothetical protein
MRPILLVAIATALLATLSVLLIWGPPLTA